MMCKRETMGRPGGGEHWGDDIFPCRGRPLEDPGRPSLFPPFCLIQSVSGRTRFCSLGGHFILRLKNKSPLAGLHHLHRTQIALPRHWCCRVEACLGLQEGVVSTRARHARIRAVFLCNRLFLSLIRRRALAVAGSGGRPCLSCPLLYREAGLHQPCRCIVSSPGAALSARRVGLWTAFGQPLDSLWTAVQTARHAPAWMCAGILS